ncbi:WhiB family transcriptional regulator [Actinokineospora enzanensis]|uniref:WhiB family transcriptional regulator n=1 Tax=Actinokineospora enzanensis TaxID=155975 RepID=UPI000365327B|nr:WhiB family transcriptional regulator [Actinokineospora enzanensis]
MSTCAPDYARAPKVVPLWHELAACRLFPEAMDCWADPKTTAQKTVARIVCAACPVRLQCATGALERRERWGIWGGLDYADRKLVAARHGYLPPGDPPEHGTNSRRVKWGCACPDCKRAHAVYEVDRRARARRAAQRRDVWRSPLLVLAAPRGRGRRRAQAGQLLLPLPGLPEVRYATTLTAA